MQHTPTVQLPEQRQRQDRAILIATLVIILVAIVALILMAYPNLLSPSAAGSVTTNPEVTLFERYQAARAAGQAIPGPNNPELSAFSRYVELQPGDLMLRENPEVRQFQQWLEGQ
jgi:hypothetical protein